MRRLVFCFTNVSQIINISMSQCFIVPNNSSFAALFEAISVRAHVAVLSCSRLDHVSSAIGQPIAPSYVPGTQSVYGEKMTMWQRFMNILQFVSGDFLFGYIGDKDYEVAKEIVPGIRSWRVSCSFQKLLRKIFSAESILHIDKSAVFI